MATNKPGFFAELKRRNVLRAAVLYVGAAWALSQGIAQLGPLFDAPNWAMRAFVIACVIGFPFWVAFAWFYEFTPQGIRRESEVAPNESVSHSTGRKLDFAIIAVLIVAVALLASGYLVRRNAPTAAISSKSIAVLPFENLSNDKNNAYFVAGMQDLILTRLADIGGIKVIARTSTVQYGSRPENLPAVGRQLGVATLLEGSVQKQGNKVLISVQLIDARTEAHIWAMSYTRTLTDVFGVEGDVATKIAASLNATLSPAQAAQLAATPTTNAAAYDAFLRAEYQANQGDINNDTADFKEATVLYRQAVQADPGFALAWARLSYMESQFAWFGGGGEDVRQLTSRARADAERALQLAPDLAASQIAIGFCEYWGRGDYAAALKAFATALRLKPNDADALAAQGYVQRRQGRFALAIASLQQALMLDPRNSGLAFDLGATWMIVSRYPEAGQAFQRALAIDPNNVQAKITYANVILYGSGDVPHAMAQVQGDDPVLKSARANLLVIERKYPEALALLDSIPDTPDTFPLGASKAEAKADLYWMMGDKVGARPLFRQGLAHARAQFARYQGVASAVVLRHMAGDELGLGQITQGLADVAKVQAIVDRSGDPVYGPYNLILNACEYARAGRADLAVPGLAKALASPGIGNSYSPLMLWLDPVWDPVRDSPQFQALLKKYAKDKPAVTYDNPAAASSSTSAD